jgi:hypothetical protein
MTEIGQQLRVSAVFVCRAERHRRETGGRRMRLQPREVGPFQSDPDLRPSHLVYVQLWSEWTRDCKDRNRETALDIYGSAFMPAT